MTEISDEELDNLLAAAWACFEEALHLRLIAKRTGGKPPARLAAIEEQLATFRAQIGAVPERQMAEKTLSLAHQVRADAEARRRAALN